MIIAERKPIAEIKALTAPYEKILIVGCATCVAVCLAGGEKEAGILNTELDILRKMDDSPSEVRNKTVERQCDMEFLSELDPLVGSVDALLSMACGAGIQFLAERFPDTPVLPAVNTGFIGVNKAMGWYEERCRACGHCVLGLTGGICPVTMCAKSLFNGPCGGTVRGGRCEIADDRACAWHAIYERLERQNRLENILAVFPTQDWRDPSPRTIVQPGYEKAD